MVSSKKKWTTMNPIRRRMKKRKASSGQNGQLVHWWLLVHSGPKIGGFFKVPCCATLERSPSRSICRTTKINKINTFELRSQQTWPFSQKIVIFWDPPNISIFYQYATMMVLFQGISWMHILSHFIAWVELLFLTLFMSIFWLSFFKSLGTYCDLY